MGLRQIEANGRHPDSSFRQLAATGLLRAVDCTTSPPSFGSAKSRRPFPLPCLHPEVTESPPNKRPRLYTAVQGEWYEVSSSPGLRRVPADTANVPR